jgi:isoleucyl-tRNA synthetase
MFQEVSTRAGFAELELAVLAFWKEHDIFHKSL